MTASAEPSTPFGLALEVGDEWLAAAAAAEGLGYRSLWVPGGQLDSLDRLIDLLGVTQRAEVAPAIISPDVHDADAVAELHQRAESIAPGRFTIGISNSQRHPSLTALGEYLDLLQRQGVPATRTIIAALGPRKLAIARDRAGGAITLLVTPEHTASARAVLGPSRRLVVDQFVVLDDDPASARETARGPLRFLTGVGGYRDNLLRMGFTDDDVSMLSDRLVDAVVAWGDENTIRHRLRQHVAGGADDVVITALPRGGQDHLTVARAFAPAVTGEAW